MNEDIKLGIEQALFEGVRIGTGNFFAFLELVKSFVLLKWDVRKNGLYGDQDGASSGCSCSCPLTGDLTSSVCVYGCVVNGVAAAT